MKNTLKVVMVFFGLFLMTGCSPMLTANKYAPIWVGSSIDKLQNSHAMRSSKNKANLLEKKVGATYDEKTTFFRAFEEYSPAGVCYTDYIIDNSTQEIIGYKIYGDEGACDY